MSAASAQALKKAHSAAENLKMNMDDAPSSSPSDASKRGGPIVAGDALSSGRLPYRELAALYEEVSQRLRKVSNEKDELALLAQQRQEAFIRTEEKYRDDMRTLELRLRTLGQEDAQRMAPLRNMQANIQDTILSIQNKTARVLQDQERDLIRAFRARLADVTVELENERRKNESGSAEWVARCRKLTEELEWLRDLTDKLTSENKAVLKDNRRFRRQMKTQEEDREFLIKSLVSVKKENARLRYSFDQLAASGGGVAAGVHPSEGQGQLPQPGVGNVSAITGQPMSAARPALRAGTPVTDAQGNRPSSSTPFGGGGASYRPNSALPSRPQSAMVQPSSGLRGPAGGASSRPGTAVGFASTGSLSSVANGNAAPMQDEDKERRYKSVVSKLQSQLADAQKSLRNLRTAHTAELASRTELQQFVRKCIDDVRQDMAERGRSASLRRTAAQARASSAHGTRGTQQRPPPPLDPRQIPLSEFTPQDRINVMEWLLSQDQVIFMLYEKIFPGQAHNPLAQSRPGTASLQQQQSQQGEQQRQGEDFAATLEVGAPGSLFHHPKQLRPASAAPAAAGSGKYTGSVGTQQRPQTVGPGHTRAPLANVSSSSASTQPARPAVSSGGIPSQYERPLGSRPLSGFEALRGEGSVVAQQQHSPSNASGQKRPHTASGYPTSSSMSGSNAPAQAAQQQHSSGLTEEERAEDAYQRQQRALAREEEGGDDENEDDDGQLAGDRGTLDPLSDEEDGFDEDEERDGQ